MFRRILYWTAHFFAYVIMIILAGAVAGAILSPVIALILHWPFTPEIVPRGAWLGLRYAGIWAGGVALVLCAIRAHRHHRFLADSDPSDNTESK